MKGFHLLPGSSFNIILSDVFSQVHTHIPAQLVNYLVLIASHVNVDAAWCINALYLFFLESSRRFDRFSFFWFHLNVPLGFTASIGSLCVRVIREVQNNCYANVFVIQMIILKNIIQENLSVIWLLAKRYIMIMNSTLVQSTVSVKLQQAGGVKLLA